MMSSKVRTRRSVALAAIATASLFVLSGCFPLVHWAEHAQGIPDESSPDNDAPDTAPDGAEMLEANGQSATGRVPADGAETVHFQLTERSAVVLGAYSPDGGDLQMSLEGEGVSEFVDDAFPNIEAFSFNQELGSFDPTIAHVLEAGTYQVDLTTYSSASADFVLELRTGTQTISPGDELSVDWEADQAAILIVDLQTGSEVLETSNASGDPKVWVSIPSMGLRDYDDDGGESLNALVEFSDSRFGGGDATEAVVIVRDYDPSSSGSAQVSLR
ncbi:hypothetical protein [uncultured Agrococcus sp.]|uniref:hypothetical protein n=1 Tax=uncultured Agrococcus sp. TaxID=382258 RepID=UPI0025E3F328|nr:hypothetical protein [uncultured Agrococcus sp.]